MKTYCLKSSPTVKAKLFEESDKNGMYDQMNGCFVHYTKKEDEKKHKGLIPYITTNKKTVDRIDFQTGKYGKCYLVCHSDGTRELIEKSLFEEKYVTLIKNDEHK